MKSTNVARVAGVFALAAMGLSTHTASAQSLPVVGPPSGFAIGDFQPASSAAKAAGKNQLNAELRYGLPGVPLTPTRSVIAVGYQHGSSNGNSSTVVPLTFTEYYGTGNWSPFSASKPYVGAGTGVYFINQSGKSSKAALGGAFSIGYNFSILFAEAQYQIVPNANGFVFDIGARF